MRVKIAAVLALVLISSASANELVLSESTVGQGGLICDTAEEVIAFIDGMEAGKQAEETLNAIPGCGILQVPMRMRVVSVGEYQTESRKFLLARYDFLDVQGPPQFGIALAAKRGDAI